MESNVKERNSINMDYSLDEIESNDYNVIMWNDDSTPIIFVIWLLATVFNKTPDEARDIALTINDAESGVVGIYPMDVAYEKVEIAEEVISECGFPLQITVERAE